MKKNILIKGLNFKKSSFSSDEKYCVGVCKKENRIIVINTKDKNETMCTFTKKEWEAFVNGVKNNEFDF